MKSLLLRSSLVPALLLSSTVFAAVSVEAPSPNDRPPVAQMPGQPRTVNPSTAEVPRNEKRPLGTAIGGANSVTPITRQGDAPLSMKCWQDGKLIIDQPVKSLPADAQKGVTMTNATNGKEMYAFDFKNAMCIIK